jgi:putative DNA primase/helicase
MSGEIRITDEELGLDDESEEEQETDHPVPQELQASDQWVCWEEVEDGSRKRKIPRVPDGSGNTARTDDPATWGSFEEAVEASSDQVGLRVGFVLTEDDPFLAIDFDDVCDPETGDTEEWVLDAMREFDSYTEVSPSATGIHIWLKDVREPEWWVDTDSIEVYDSGQYITVTGDHLSVASTTCSTPADFEEWLQSHAEVDVPDASEAQQTSESPQNDIDLGVYDVLSHSSYPEEERVSHPSHDSGTGTNFKVDGGGDTWRCYRHNVSGNALHLIGMEEGVISCGDWKNRDLIDQEWAELFEAGREAGYDIPDHPDERQQISTQTNIVEAMIESPSDWIWPDEKNIIARPVGDANARKVRDQLEQQSLESDEVLELMAELDEEYSNAFNEFWQTPEAWSVSMEGPDHSWKQVKDLYSEKGQSDSARDLAVRLLRKEYDFITVRDNEQMYCYNPETGVYESNAEQVVKARLEDMLERHYSSYEAREIIGRLKAGGYVDREDFGQSGSSVCVVNGVVDIETGEVSDFSPGYNFRSRLPVEYDPEAECPQFREFLEEVCPDDKIPQLQEFVGYCLQPQTNHKKALLLLGPTDAGKSVFLDVLQALFGADSTVNLSVQYLANQRWGEAELVGRMVNIRHDLDSTDIKNVGKIKELTAGNPVRAERKNQDPFRFEPRTKHIFAANQPPARSAEDDGFWNRWLTVVFPERIPRQEQDPKLTEKLTTDDELAGVLNWAIEGYQHLEEQGRFTNEPTPSDNQRIWEMYGSSVEQFINCCLDREPGSSVRKDEAYTEYEAFAKSEEMEVVTKTKFTSILKEKGASVPQRRFDDGRKRVYTGFTLTDS